MLLLFNITTKTPLLLLLLSAASSFFLVAYCDDDYWASSLDSQDPNIICGEPPLTGLCRGYFPRYHYDPYSKACKQFIFGGCGGNSNSFDTEKSCYETCNGSNPTPYPTPPSPNFPRNIEAICREPRDAGTCSDTLIRYFYNVRTSSCQAFTWSGCGGNSNRFKTLSACYTGCFPDGNYPPPPTPQARIVTASSLQQSTTKLIVTDGILKLRPPNGTTPKKPDIFTFLSTTPKKVKPVKITTTTTTTSSSTSTTTSPKTTTLASTSTSATTATSKRTVTSSKTTEFRKITSTTTTPRTTTQRLTATTISSKKPNIIFHVEDDYDYYESDEQFQTNNNYLKTTAALPTTTITTTTTTEEPFTLLALTSPRRIEDRCYQPKDVGLYCNGNFMWRYYYDKALKVCRLFSFTGCGGNSNRFPTIQACRIACEQAVWRPDTGAFATLLISTNDIDKNKDSKPTTTTATKQPIKPTKPTKPTLFTYDFETPPKLPQSSRGDGSGSGDHSYTSAFIKAGGNVNNIMSIYQPRFAATCGDENHMKTMSSVDFYVCRNECMELYSTCTGFTYNVVKRQCQLMATPCLQPPPEQHADRQISNANSGIFYYEKLYFAIL